MSLSPEIIAALVGLISSTFVAAFSLYGAKKLGIGTSQIQLISTLKDITSAQDTRIEQLEKSDVEKDAKIAALIKDNADKDRVILQQAIELSAFKKG